MKSNFQKIAVLCTCTGLLCSCGQSDNKQEHHKEFIPITILHPTTIEFPRSYVADVQAIQFVEIKPKVEGFNVKNRHKAQRKAKFYINKCRSASCMQGGLKQASA